MPDAYDPISARIIEKAGFKAVQCSGYSISVAACLKSETELSRDDNVEATRRIADAVSVPVMADGEDGYGGPGLVGETIRRFIRAGAAGMNIEDLVSSGSPASLTETDLMVEKIIAAREAANIEGNPDFIINARTDALSVIGSGDAGLCEAVKRANLYFEAGADLAFVTRVATIDEVKILVKEINGPVSITAGMLNNIRSLTIDDLRQQGVARVSIPAAAIYSVVKALLTTVSLISEPDGFLRIADEGLYCSPKELSALLQD